MPLITAPVGISREDATALLRKHKRERLPLVDEAGPPRRADHRQGLREVRAVPQRLQGRRRPPARRRRRRLLRRGVAARHHAGRGRRRRARRRHRPRPRPAAARHDPPAQGRPGHRPRRRSSAATSPPATAPRRSSTPASTRSRSASVRARSARRAWSPASAYPRSPRSTTPRWPAARPASRSSPTVACSTPATSPRRSSPAPSR